MSSRYAPLTGMDINDKNFFIPDEPVQKKTVPSIESSKTPYKKFSQKPVHTAPKPPDTSKTRHTTSSAVPENKPVFRLVKVYGWVFAVAIGMTLWIWEIASVRSVLLDIEILKDKKLEIEKTNEALRADIARLTGYQRIEKVANEQLKMHPPKEKPGVLLVDAAKIRQAQIADSLNRYNQ
jgi:cell division protein FtsL